MDSELYQVKDKISKLEFESKCIGDQLSTLYRRRAILVCSYKIGDILVSRKVEGYGKNKKPITRKVRIGNIKPKSWEPYYTLIGVNIRKDGTEGESRELWQSDWILEEKEAP